MEVIILLLVYYVIPFLFICTIILIFTLLIKRIRFEYIKPIRESVSSKIENFLIEMVLTKPNKTELQNHLLRFKKEIPLNKSWCKEAIITQMIAFNNNIEGDISEQINILYKVLKLDKFSKKLLSNVQSCHKCEGFYHFQALNYTKGIPFIKPYLKNKDIVIRSSANMAYISLTENYMESFKELKSGISNLTIIKLMDIIHVKKIPIPINIDQWLETNYTSMTKLGLKIMVFYNYNKKSKEITELIKHRNDSLKIEAIITIRELFIIDAKQDMLVLFDQVLPKIQVEILKTLEIIGDVSIVSFLENVIHLENNKDVKLAAVRCLNTIDQKVLNIIADSDCDTQKMVKHVREIYL